MQNLYFEKYKSKNHYTFITLIPLMLTLSLRGNSIVPINVCAWYMTKVSKQLTGRFSL